MLRINNEIKNQIIALINKFPGAFRNYSETDTALLLDNTISKEMCITALENAMYNCQSMRSTIKSHTIYDTSFNSAENIYASIPKHPEYREDSGIFYEDIPEFKSMSSEMLLSTLSDVFKAQTLFTNVLIHQSFTNRAERILESLESIQNQQIQLSDIEKIKVEQIYFGIKEQLNSEQEINLQNLNSIILSYNDIAVNIWNRYLDSGRCFLVHNYSRGHIDNFTPSKYLSTSLISDKFMALFQENYNNNYGFIVKPKKIVAADSKDTFTHNRSESIGIDMFLSGEVPPILFPWEIEEEAIKKSLNMNGEILNYDNGYVLPEIVLEDYEIIGVYYRTNGEGKLSPSYEAAFELAESKSLVLKEIDMSFARMQAGLEPMTNEMQKNFFLNIIRKNYMQEKNVKKYFGRSNHFDKLEDEKIISKYFDVMYNSYLELRKTGNLSEETLLQEISSTISSYDMSIIQDFYHRYTETYNNSANEIITSVLETNENSEQEIFNKTLLSKQQPIFHEDNIESKKLQDEEELIQKQPFDQRSGIEVEIAEQIRVKNQAIAEHKKEQKQSEKPKVLVKTNSSTSSNGYVNVVILSLILSFIAGMLTIALYLILR